jgi:hypothetical protein
MPESLKKRVYLITSRKAANAGVYYGLRGCPVGGWGETQQAWRQIHDELPWRRDRAYTMEQLIACLYEVDFADRYAARPDDEALRLAGVEVAS